MKKYYPEVNSVDLAFKEENILKSKIFESIIVRELDAEFFWRDPYKNEVDVVQINSEIIPIKIKYGKLDISGLLTFMKKFHLNKGIIISYEDKKIIEKK